jgi:uncharacterized protein (TIGR02246 family)
MVNTNNIISKEKQSFLDLAREFDRAWNDRDAQRFSSFFTKDGDMHFITMNMHMRGKDEVAETYMKMFSEMPPELQHRTTVKGIHPVTHDVVLLDGVTDIITSNASGTETILRRHTGATVLVRTDAGWRIRAIRIWSEQISTQ